MLLPLFLGGIIMRIITYTTALDSEKKNILVKEKSINYETDVLRKPERIAKMMCDVFSLHNMAEEYLYMLSFNTKCKLLGVFEISHGDVCASVMGAREIFIRNLLAGATGFVLVHNHPSGDPTPSDIDINSTNRIKAASQIMGVQLLDHIIVGENNQYFSFSESGIISQQ